MTTNRELSKLVFIASAIALGYFLLIGFLSHYSLVIPGIIGEVFRGIHELIMIPLMLFVPVGFLFCLYRIIFEKIDKKTYIASGLLTFAALLWIIYIFLNFD